MSKIHIVATAEYGVVTLQADRVYHADTGALMFFSGDSEVEHEVQSATFAPGAWRLHFNPADENTEKAWLEHLGFMNKSSRDAPRVDDPA